MGRFVHRGDLACTGSDRAAIHATDLWEEISAWRGQCHGHRGEAAAALSQPEYGNVMWKVIPDNTLPATGNRYAYFVMNKPVGTMYFKPDLSGKKSRRRLARITRSGCKFALLECIPTSHRVRICRVKFATT
jgi:hypothetical protein